MIYTTKFGIAITMVTGFISLMIETHGGSKELTIFKAGPMAVMYCTRKLTHHAW